MADHFLKILSKFNEIWCTGVLMVADYESDIIFSKFKMADPI